MITLNLIAFLCDILSNFFPLMDSEYKKSLDYQLKSIDHFTKLRQNPKQFMLSIGHGYGSRWELLLH